MIDYNKEIVVALSQILPTYPELTLTSGTKTPCLSYMEIDNHDREEIGDTIGYSNIKFQIKVWSTQIATLEQSALEVDTVMRQLGFRRRSASQINDNQSAMMQKILVYEAIGVEEY